MAKQMLLYRGSLKSCNYSCSYCPFSKHRSSEKELNRDREQWLRFCDSLLTRQKEASAAGRPEIGAVMAAPYGEALIHPWYWEGLAALSSLETMDAVGAQTNLSFLPRESLHRFDRAGGKRSKLRLWASFHPEMISVSGFSAQCSCLINEGIQVCAGAVGVPDNIDLIRQLREALSSQTYLWINRMDGLKRPYTPQEQATFQSIDPYFPQELRHRKAKPSQCQNRLFVEGDGSMHICNISLPAGENWYAQSADPLTCGRSTCSCYLAYAGRQDFENRFHFGRYPLFRIPWKPKAFFFDIDGTLIPRKGVRPDPGLLKTLEELSEKYPLFFATSLPYAAAIRRCHDFSSLFSGGIFSGGAHVLLAGKYERRETFLPLDDALADVFRQLMHNHPSPLSAGFRTHIYENGSAVYKATLEKPSGRPWLDPEIKPVLDWLSGYPLRCVTEENCLQVTAPLADKGRGAAMLCRYLDISPKDTVCAGNSHEDIPMFDVCGYAIAPSDSPPDVLRAADMIWG